MIMNFSQSSFSFVNHCIWSRGVGHVEHACVEGVMAADQWNVRCHRLRGRTGTLGGEGWYWAYQSGSHTVTTHRTSSQGLLAFEMCISYDCFALHKPHWTALWEFYRDKLVGVRGKVRNETLNVEPLIKQQHSYPQNNKYPELCQSIIVSAPHFGQHSNLTQPCRIKKSKPQGCEFFIN